MAETKTSTGIPAPGIAVIGAGFGRTGTASLKQALEDLGFGPCDHMHENFDHPDRFALWSDAMWRKDAGEPIDWRPLLHHLEQTGGESLPGDIIVDRTFSRRTDDLAHCLAVFVTHNQVVRNAIDSDRLLVFDVAEGWESLCAFLGVPVPDGEAFPHLNDTEEFQSDERKKID